MERGCPTRYRIIVEFEFEFEFELELELEFELEFEVRDRGRSSRWRAPPLHQYKARLRYFVSPRREEQTMVAMSVLGNKP